MSTVTIRYFARLREQLGVEQEVLELPQSVTTVLELKNFLAARGEKWQQAMTSAPSILAAVNQTMATNAQTLAASDEVAFFPPVTGG